MLFFPRSCLKLGYHQYNSGFLGSQNSYLLFELQQPLLVIVDYYPFISVGMQETFTLSMDFIALCCNCSNLVFQYWNLGSAQCSFTLSRPHILSTFSAPPI